MSRRTLVPALVAMALLGAAVVASRYLHWGGEPEQAAEAGAPELRPLDPPLAARLARLDARLRLPPDRRAILAIGEIRRLVRGGAAAEAEASFANGSWKIAYEGKPVGMLSAYPRFSALLALLGEWAAKERGEPGALKLGDELEIRPELQDRLNHFDDAAASEVLAEVDARWREKRASVGDLLAASDALAQLCAILPRDSEAADRLAARAFAMLALARQYQPDRTLRAEITLAFATGYATHARALAERLPSEEPLAAFVRADLDSLERSSRPVDAGHVDFFYGARLLQRRGGDAWLAWYEELPAKRAHRLAVVGTALEDSGASTGKVVPKLYTELLSATSQLVNERPQYRGAQGVALYRELAFLTETAHQPAAALERVRAWPQGGSADVEALREWTELVATGAARSGDVAVLSKALANPALLAPAREVLARRALAALPVEDPRREAIANVAAARLDSRPAGCLFAGELAHDAYRDPDLEDKSYAAAADAYGEEPIGLVSRVAGFRRDWQTLWSIVESDTSRADEKLAALEALERQKPLEAERMRRGYANLLVADPDSEPLRKQFARFLDKGLGDRRAARNVLAPVLAAHPQHDRASDSIAGIIAKLHLEDGHPEEAWALLEARVERMVVPSQVVRTQIALGNLPRAEELARAAYARYPQSLQVASDLTMVLWEAGRNADAAQVIATFAGPDSDKERCWQLCRAFARTFKGRAVEEVKAAFQELVAAKVDAALLEGTIDLFRSTAEPETALALGNLLDAPGAPVDVYVESYKTLKQMRGEGEAVRWLAPKIPSERLGEAARAFYLAETDELLWKIGADPRQPAPAETWLYRAAAFAREAPPSAAHRAVLAAYFAAHQTTRDEQIGAALAGLIEPEALLRSARTEDELSRAAYFLGVRAEGARDLREAMRMYQLALASPERTPARDLAHDAVTRIRALDASLDALAAARPTGAVVAAER